MRLFYHVVNGGDGSAYPEFHKTHAQAQRADEGQYERWAEDSDGYVELEIRDGKLYFLGRDSKDREKWIEVK